MTEYNLRIRNSLEGGFSGDPFKKALYQLVGRADLSKPPSAPVALGASDWLWFKLSVVSESGADGELGGEKYGLRDLGKTVSSLKDRMPLERFRMLLIGGEFEKVRSFVLEELSCTSRRLLIASSLPPPGRRASLRSTTVPS